MKYVDFFTRTAPNPDLLGGKGANLVKLVKFQFNIPPGFIINTKSYEKFLEESEYSDQITELISKDFKSKEIMHLSPKIKDLILKSSIPEDVMDEIKSAYDKICENIGGGASFAVRSSATIEDSSKFSFAGQADTFLYNKTYDDILTSLKKCWVSLFSPRAMLYLLQMKKMGIDLSIDNVQMAVVVQKMVNSQISGVLFTINVVNNEENQMMINSTWGLGETIASNSVNPDTIIINKDKFEIIKSIIGKKERKAIQNPESSGVILIETDEQSGMVCSLTDNQLRQLQNLGLKIEKAFKCPQDIEWAIENDKIYILQSRPITTLKK